MVQLLPVAGTTQWNFQEGLKVHAWSVSSQLAINFSKAMVSSLFHPTMTPSLGGPGLLYPGKKDGDQQTRDHILHSTLRVWVWWGGEGQSPSSWGRNEWLYSACFLGWSLVMKLFPCIWYGKVSYFRNSLHLCILRKAFKLLHTASLAPRFELQ